MTEFSALLNVFNTNSHDLVPVDSQDEETSKAYVRATQAGWVAALILVSKEIGFKYLFIHLYHRGQGSIGFSVMCECLRLPIFVGRKLCGFVYNQCLKWNLTFEYQSLHDFFRSTDKECAEIAYKEFRLSFLQSAGDPHATIYLLDISLESLNSPHGFVIEDPRFLRLLPACAKTSIHDINQLYINRCIVPIQYSLTLLLQADWLCIFKLRSVHYFHIYLANQFYAKFLRF